MARAQKKEKLNIFLMKEGTSELGALRSGLSGLRNIPISITMGFSGVISVRRSDQLPPRWVEFIKAGTDGSIGDLKNQNCGAVISLGASGRTFCITFGSGFHWIDDQKVERRFGMMVTLNSVHPEWIRSVDREEFDIITRTTRSQTSVRSSIENFGMDVQRDLVRSVSGQPENQEFAAHVAGGDSLTLSAPIKFEQLASKCSEALATSREARYKER